MHPSITLIASIASPQTCLACGHPSRSERPLCPDCAKKHFGADPAILARSRCQKCGRPLLSAIDLCVDCRNLGMLKSIDKVIPLFPYDAVGQDALIAWKLRGKRSLSRVFAGFLAVFISSSPELRGLDIVPVPPRPKKIREKGWDQIRELCSVLSGTYSLPVNDCLRRTSSLQQKKLGRSARFTNIKGSVLMKEGARTGDSAIVLDDLMTTGSTLDACADELKNAGCGKVYGLTLFYD